MGGEGKEAGLKDRERGGGGAWDQKGRASCCSALCSSVITLTRDSMARPRSSAMWNKLPILGPLMDVPFSLPGYEGKNC